MHEKAGAVEQQAIKDSHNEDENQFKFTFGVFMAMVALTSGYMSAVFCIQMASIALVTINEDIGPSPSFTWIANSQVIPVAIFGPLVGRLGDIFGRRQSIMLGNLSGLIGCVISATATRVEVVIGGGIFIGLATSLQQQAWASLGEIVPKKYRGLTLGLFELANIAPGAFGPIIGAAIVKGAGWRWVYWFPFILNTIGFFLIFLFYRPKNQYIKEAGRTRMQEVMDLDWIGIALWGVGLTLFLLGISFGGNQLAWKSGGTIAMIVIGLLMLVALGFYEAYVPQVLPLFPGVVLRKIRGVTLVLIGTFLFGMLYYSTAVLWPQQTQALYTHNIIDVGWYGCALGMAGIPTSVITGYLFGKIGHARIMFTVIIAVGTIGAGLMALVTPTSSTESTVFVAMIGLCTGGGFVVAAAMIQLAVEHEYIGIATALCVTARNVGGAVATVIYTAIFTGRLKFYVSKYVVMGLLKAGVAPASLLGATFALLGEGPETGLAGLTPAQIEVGLNGVKQSYAHALRIVYLSSIGFGVIGTVCVAFTKNCDDKMTNQVDIKLNEGAKLTGITDEGKGHIISVEEQENLRHRHQHQSN
ncbi:MFS general substrate transporter [Lophium mytilinum]|uniref:MFS general substrate transporter n=1 Tax=Lophium mytilinum TaxID=390894 RepID=A0A6A6QE00_9PEZI|nr:MFS general substrate transporter [Lophium mytilinum]